MKTIEQYFPGITDLTIEQANEYYDYVIDQLKDPKSTDLKSIVDPKYLNSLTWFIASISFRGAFRAHETVLSPFPLHLQIQSCDIWFDLVNGKVSSETEFIEKIEDELGFSVSGMNWTDIYALLEGEGYRIVNSKEEVYFYNPEK